MTEKDEELVEEDKRQREYCDRLWNEMGRDITKLSKDLQQELANFRRAILAMDMGAENKSIMKCVKIGTKQDGLPSTFVVDRINEIMQGR